MEIRSFYLDPSGQVVQNLATNDLAQAIADEEHLVWVDVHDPQSEAGDFLHDTFGFHPLAIEACTSTIHQPSRVDEFEDHLFVILHGVDYTSTRDHIETARLSAFIKKGLLVTVHRLDLITLDQVVEQLTRDSRHLQRGEGFLAYFIFDALMENVLPTIDRLMEVAEHVEERSLDQPDRSVLETILDLKRSVSSLHRMLVPQRNVMGRLARGEFPVIATEAEIYFRDVFDRITQLDVLVDGLRGTIDNAMATYLSAVGIRQNEAMRILAVVTTIFLPLTLIAGIYGMNLQMPETELSWAYPAVLGVMASMGFLALWLLWGKAFMARFRQVRHIGSLRIDPRRVDPRKIGHFVYTRAVPRDEKRQDS
jgi:magnesium transporter